MKDELSGQIMKDFVRLIAKPYSYLNDNKKNKMKIKKSKRHKKCAIKRKVKFQDYKNCLEAAQIENKVKQLEKTIIDVSSLKED